MLQQNDVDALLAALVSSQETENGVPIKSSNRSFNEVKIYDFVRPDNLPSEFLRALENINSSFGRVLAGLLTGYLSLSVQVETLSIDQMTYRQFCNAVPELTTLVTFSIGPLEGTALFELNPHLAWYLIDRGLGGQGELIESPREFTAMERGLLDDLFRRILREFGKTWETLLPLKPTLREVLHNPTIVRTVQPDDRMVVCSFGITMSGISGMCNYCIPISSLDFERLLSSDNNWESPGLIVSTQQEQERVEELLLNTLMPVRACLPDLIVPVGELASLRAGDIIHLDTMLDDPVIVRMGNVACFSGRPVTMKDRMAVEIIAEQSEEEHE